VTLVDPQRLGTLRVRVLHLVNLERLNSIYYNGKCA
jgi:hypothetical protein